jgi:hypothetical protein
VLVQASPAECVAAREQEHWGLGRGHHHLEADGASVALQLGAEVLAEVGAAALLHDAVNNLLVLELLFDLLAEAVCDSFSQLV